MRVSASNWLQGLLVLILIALTIWGFVALPLDEALPIHWDIAGTPDRFAPAPMALLLAPALTAAIIAIFWVLRRVSTPQQREARVHVEDAIVVTMTALAIVLQSAIILIGLGMDVDIIRVIALALAAVFVVLGNVLPKSRRNALAGIRIPPALADDANWQATQRFGGWLYVVAGLSLGILAFMTNNQVVLLVSVIAAAVIPALAATVFSYRYTR